MAQFQCDPDLLAATDNDSLPASILKSSQSRLNGKPYIQKGRRVSIDASMVWSPPPSSIKSVTKMRMEAVSGRKTPKKTPLKKTSVTTTEATNNNNVPPNKPVMRNQGDRFIPNRALMDMELSQYKVAQLDLDGDAEDVENREGDGYKVAISEGLDMKQKKDCKILTFKQNVPKAAEGFSNRNKVLYSSAKKTISNTGKSRRQIPQTEEKILDAPDLRDDFYLSLIDWSTLNVLAVALNQEVYLWNASSSNISHLLTLQGEDEYVSSVSWISEGNILAVGNSSGHVQLWDVEAQKCLRNMEGHSARVCAIDWNYYIVTSGAGTGRIHHHDVRVAEHHIATLNNHTQQVCGLKWNIDGSYLASGGNDNVLNIWDASTSTGVSPLYTLTHHQAAVKAVSWCPWQTYLLASGGGTADRTLRFWAANTGTCLKTVDTGSQVSSILWSKEWKELISGHGFSQNQLTIWKYPNMDRIVNLTGHTDRVLTMCLSPDQQTVVSAAGDETLRFWRCFSHEPKKKTIKAASSGETKSRSLFASTIR